MSRRLDAAIHEALGNRVEWLEAEDLYVTPVDGDWESVPFYHANGNAMLLLDEEMRKRGWWVQVWRMLPATYERFTAVYRRSDAWTLTTESMWEEAWGLASTEPLARAMAAYKALTGKKWVEEGGPDYNAGK